MAAPMNTGWMMVPKGRPMMLVSVVRAVSWVGTPRNDRPSTPPVFHWSTTTTNSTAANTAEAAEDRPTPSARLRTRTAT